MTTATETTFEQAYADAIISDMTDEQFDEASKARQLSWRGVSMPLSEAAKLYAKIDSYNEYEGNMLPDLLEAFPEGILAIPARESSVVVYLLMSDSILQDVIQFIRTNWNADEVDMQPDGSLRVWWD